MKRTVVLLILTLALGSVITGCSLNRKAGKISEAQTEETSEDSKKQTGKKMIKKQLLPKKKRRLYRGLIKMTRLPLRTQRLRKYRSRTGIPMSFMMGI